MTHLQNHESNVIGVTDKYGHYNFWCDGCNNVHHLYTVPDENGNYYTFNGKLRYPTFEFTCQRKGMYGYTQTKPIGADIASPLTYCRFEIKDGIITYHKTCSHELAGKSLQMRSRSNWGGFKITKVNNQYQAEIIKSNSLSNIIRFKHFNICNN